MNSEGKLNPITRAVLAYSLRTPAHRGKWRVIKALVSIFKLHPRGRFLETRSGLKWSLNPEDYTNQDLFWTGTKDAWEMHHLERILPQGATIFDVGANFGYYSLVLASRLGPDSRAFAFEPNPTTFPGLEENIRLNPQARVTAYRLGLSDTIGTAGLATRSGNSGATFLTEGDAVSTTTLDAFCKDHPDVTSIEMIKVDIEGYEERFLKGATASLTRFKPIILIELNPVALPRCGSSVERVVALLRSYGYQLFQIHRERLVEFTHLPDANNHLNVLCVHPQRKLGNG